MACQPGRVEACEAGAGCAGARTCEAGGTWGPCEGPAEACDGVDNDCDGSVDEGFGVGEACRGEGACAPPGVLVCGADGLVCDAPRIEPTPEVCDGRDNDCDGQVDEELLGEACRAGVGACAAPGRLVCTAGDFVCDAEPLAPRAEACDGVDNDCDGQTDEGGVCAMMGCNVNADCPADQFCAEAACRPGVPLPANESYGAHGSCNDWNACVDAEGCANAACALYGHGPAVRWVDGQCLANQACRIFNDFAVPPDADWAPRGDCGLPVASAVVCAPAGGAVGGDEICDDGVDNDGDGFVDCVDFDCAGVGACPGEVCDDGIDNDGDGFVDCDDFNCDGDLACGPMMNGQVGLFAVGDGPDWTAARATSCVAQCARLFGGAAAGYGCSTVNGQYNGRAFVNGYSDRQYCRGNGVDEAFVQPGEGQLYNCGANRCSYSAYVSDGAECDNSINYCWRR